jgi:hypothetical protein
MPGLPPHFIELVYDALLKSFWRKPALKRFLKASGISDNALAQLDTNETKRNWLDSLFPKLEAAQKGPALITSMAHSLAEQTTFPDLENWEDSKQKIDAAKQAVKALRDYIGKKDEEQARQAEKDAVREKAKEIREKKLREQSDLLKLRERLDALVPRMGSQGAGYDFQTWFYDLMDYCEVDNRRPFVSVGRQIDGSLTIDGTTYLVELKFTGPQSDATDIDSLKAKIESKSDNTMGVMVSMSGYSSVAVTGASIARTTVLLFDFSHLYMVLQGIETFQNVIRRVRRHSSQTGSAYLAVSNFGGQS